MEKREGFWLFTSAGRILKAMKGQWNGQQYQLEMNCSINLDLTPQNPIKF
jgi:hypothetical protein